MVCAALAGIATLLVACSGSHPPQPGLPLPDRAALVNSYVGGRANPQADDVLWNITFDREKNLYSYGPTAEGAPATNGSLLPVNHYLVLLDQHNYQNGLAYEIPGRVVVLRPGNRSTAPLFAVQQSDCFTAVGNVKFLYAFSGASLSGNQGQPVYGKIYLTSTGDGKSWTFNGQAQYSKPDGKSVPADAYTPVYPTGYAGSCQSSKGSASAEIPSTTVYNVPTEYRVGPSGFFLENQRFVDVPELSAYGIISAWGLTGPSASLSTKTVASANYRGFFYDSNANASGPQTYPVGFGGVAVSGTAMSGGALPNEDPAQTPATDMTLDFGKQDPLNYGVYYFAKLTLPAAGNLSCSSYGTDSLGNPTCTYNAVAMVSFPERKYAVIVSIFDNSGYQKVLMLFEQ
jgi:hypothetical protein